MSGLSNIDNILIVSHIRKPSVTAGDHPSNRPFFVVAKYTALRKTLQRDTFGRATNDHFHHFRHRIRLVLPPRRSHTHAHRHATHPPLSHAHLSRRYTVPAIAPGRLHRSHVSSVHGYIVRVGGRRRAARSHVRDVWVEVVHDAQREKGERHV